MEARDQLHHQLPRGRAPLREELVEDRVVGVGPRRSQLIVGGDQLRRHARDREQRDGQQAGAIATADAMEEHSARPRPLDRVEHALERGTELGPVHPVGPELGVLIELVEGDMDHLDTGGRAARLDALVVVAQVDDRPQPIRAQCVPAGAAEAVGRAGAD